MDYYRQLEVAKNATADDIKKAYRRLAMKFHPDHNLGDDQKFKEICEAYDVLKDLVKRAKYDSGQYKPPKKPAFVPPRSPFNFTIHVDNENVDVWDATPRKISKQEQDLLDNAKKSAEFRKQKLKEQETQKAKERAEEIRRIRDEMVAEMAAKAKNQRKNDGWIDSYANQYF